MYNKKYEFTGETKQWLGCTLHRIRAVVSFAYVKEGEIGGWIETESNLSHCGNAWVCDDARVFGNALVCGDAWVCGNARVCDDALVCDNALVCGDAWVCGNARVFGNALVCGDAWVCGNARVCDDALVCDNARVCGNADYIVFKNYWSSMRWFTYTRSNKKWKVGCFYGTGDELVKKAYADSEKSGKCYEAIVKAAEAIDAAMQEETK